ncbi:hypothetical protein AX769_06815 [Frondihabitans sp. PAMC 28766]|uniref:hypothetical protein n=1 Tax=Frondihabitans sp. PAMC 28766 TaxID=1795630 RepID=UPI00078C160F|nr:hypothetical protein [Frondihabitans sp. PAMC 28766]AMM19921.1 hypothetical protein AX769_06815 [Frondihabitans sp. PAMC 28766]
MAGDARFGIELDEHSGETHPGDGPAETQLVAGEEMSIVGHVWSRDAERIVQAPDGRVLIIDPSGANPALLNTGLDKTEAFLEAFRVFYLGDRPPVVPQMTVAEARERLAALQRGETLADPVAPAAAPRADRVAILRQTLTEQDAMSIAPGTWWSRILQRPEFDA